MSDSLQPHGLWPTMILHPWDFPGNIQFHQYCPLNHSVSCSTLDLHASFDQLWPETLPSLLQFHPRCHFFPEALNIAHSKNWVKCLPGATIYFFHSTFHTVIVHCLYSPGHSNLPGGHVSFITAFLAPSAMVEGALLSVLHTFDKIKIIYSSAKLLQKYLQTITFFFTSVFVTFHFWGVSLQKFHFIRIFHFFHAKYLF